MRQRVLSERGGHRRRRLTLGTLAALTVALTAAGCGSNAQAPQAPAGLDTSATHGSQLGASNPAARANQLAPQQGSFLFGKNTVTTLASTTPANGDVNPYSIWPVTQTIGSLKDGDILVDNFNNKSNNQGTGTTIVDVHPDNSMSVFAELPAAIPGCPGGVGLTTAMVQLKTGWVIVGSLPTTDGKIATSGPGCLIELSPTGQVAGTISAPYLNGPWDAAVQDNGDTATLFVTNVLYGVKDAGNKVVNQGTVARLSLTQTQTTPPQVTAETDVATGLPERQDAAALIKGPTGLVLDTAGTLYIGDNLGNRVATVPNALTRTDSADTGATLSQGGQLANPLAMALAPGGNLLVANATNGKIVELTPAGTQVGEFYAISDVGQSPPGNGDLFGIAVNQAGNGVLFVADDTNTLALMH
jgi:hypothetical protein